MMADRGVQSRYESEPAPPEELLSRLRTAVAATPAPRTRTRVRVDLAIAVLPCLIAAILVVGSRIVFDQPVLRVDLGALVTTRLLLSPVLVVAVALLATRVSVGRGERGLGYGATSLFLVALLVTPSYALLTLVYGADTGVAPAALSELSPWGLGCLTLAGAVGLFVLVGLAAALRRSVPVAGRLRGAALGAAAGAWAGLSVFLHCPATARDHLLVGHLLPVFVFTLLGLAFLPRLLRP